MPKKQNPSRKTQINLSRMPFKEENSLFATVLHSPSTPSCGTIGGFCLFRFIEFTAPTSALFHINFNFSVSKYLVLKHSFY